MSTTTALPRFALATLAICGLLTACMPLSSNEPPADLKVKAETYIREHIADLSPTPAVLGGHFYVTKLQWKDADTVQVDYEDGHISLSGTTEIASDGSAGMIVVPEDQKPAPVKNDDQDDDSDASAADASAAADPRAPRGEGQFCGGIAGFQCQTGLHCEIKETYPDAGGTCVKD
jgi:hypothetical protein